MLLGVITALSGYFVDAVSSAILNGKNILNYLNLTYLYIVKMDYASRSDLNWYLRYVIWLAIVMVFTYLAACIGYVLTSSLIYLIVNISQEMQREVASQRLRQS
jgi:hypothetical protein